MNRQTRPKLKLPLTAWDYLCEAIALAGLVTLMGVAFSAWPSLPASVPSHFGPDGRADAFGPRGTMLILPSVGFVLSVALTVIQLIPHALNYPVSITPGNAARQYRIARVSLCAMKAEIVWLFAYIEWRAVAVAAGDPRGLGAWFLPVFVTVLILTAAFMVWRSYQER
jgi:uncharacterized membrane protein